jgi:four helix bundle protein
MTPEEMKQRTKDFALRVVKATQALPKGGSGDVIGRQLLRSGTSVGANYRAACRARSVPDFISKMGLVEEEADESAYWMELLIDAGLISGPLLSSLLKEADQLVAMAVASINTARRNGGPRRK